MNAKTWYVHRKDNSLEVGSYTYKTCVFIEKANDKPAKWDNWETIFRPRFKCVRTVKLINVFLHCTCNHYDHIDIS